MSRPAKDHLVVTLLEVEHILVIIGVTHEVDAVARCNGATTTAHRSELVRDIVRAHVVIVDEPVPVRLVLVAGDGSLRLAIDLSDNDVLVVIGLVEGATDGIVFAEVVEATIGAVRVSHGHGPMVPRIDVLHGDHELVRDLLLVSRCVHDACFGRMLVFLTSLRGVVNGH